MKQPIATDNKELKTERDMADFYKRNEKKILSLLLAVFVIGTILVWVDLGKGYLSHEDSAGIAVDAGPTTDSINVGIKKHDVRYKLRKAKYDIYEYQKLVAYVDSAMYDDILSDADGSVIGAESLCKVADLDNDGYDEAVVLTYMVGIMGNATDGYYKTVVYFDPETKSFKTASGEELQGDVIQEDGQWFFVEYKNSLKYARYTFNKGNIRKVDEGEKEMQAPLITYNTDQMFPDANDSGKQMLKRVRYDMNGDGIDDEMNMEYWDAIVRANDFGDAMTVVSIVTVDATGSRHTIEANITCGNISILPSKTNGMNDLMVNSYNGILIYQYDGKRYRLVVWNGKGFVTYKQQ